MAEMVTEREREVYERALRVRSWACFHVPPTHHPGDAQANEEDWQTAQRIMEDDDGVSRC